MERGSEIGKDQKKIRRRPEGKKDHPERSRDDPEGRPERYHRSGVSQIGGERER